MIVQLPSTCSKVSVACVESSSGLKPSAPRNAERAIVKQPAWAAAISSSGFVPTPFSKRVENEYCVCFSTPLWVETVPLPCLRSPFQTALAVREVEHVLDLIRTLKWDGISVILISHRLTDVFSVCDRIVVLRQGQVIADDATRDTSMNAVVAHIVGAMDERLQRGHA